MAISPVFQQLIAEFYEAAFKPRLWEHAFASLCQATCSEYIIITTSNTDHESLSRARLYNIEASAWDFYINDLLAICPRIRYARRAKPGDVFYDHCHSSDEIIARSEYYRLLEQHCGTRYYMAKLLPITDYSVAHFSLHRKGSQGHYRAEDITLLEALAPHILRALQLNTKFSVRDCVGPPFGDTGTSPDSMIILDSNSIPLHICGHAHSVIVNAVDLRIEAGALVTGYGPDQAKLDNLVNLALRSSLANETPGRVMPLHRKSGGRAFTVRVSPISQRDNFYPILDAAVAVFITDPEQYVLPDMDFLSELYRFTPKEANLMAAFIKCGSLPETTAKLGISKNTARAHLQNIFKKTATTSQADLMKLVLSC